MLTMMGYSYKSHINRSPVPKVKINGISLYYEIFGNGQEALIMIMGLGRTHVGWPTVMVEELSRHYQVIAFDNRGVGKSDAPNSPYTMQQFAADTIGLLDHLNLGKANIYGISMGGAIAQNIALLYPSKVNRMILGCTNAGIKHAIPTDKDVMEALAKAKTGDPQADFWNSLHLFVVDEFRRNNKELLQNYLNRILAYPQQSPEAYSRQFDAFVKTHDTFEKLDQITCPFLVQTGIEDIIIPPENSRKLVEKMPNATLKEYPGAGHRYYLEKVYDVTQDILEFLG